MATSDSDDFESADEELATRNAPARKSNAQWKKKNSAIDSESDDDNECMQPKTDSWNSGNHSVQTSGQERRPRTSASKLEAASVERSCGETVPKDEAELSGERSGDDASSQERREVADGGCTAAKDEGKTEEKPRIDAGRGRKERVQRQPKPRESKSLGAKKLGSKLKAGQADLSEDWTTPDEVRSRAAAEGKDPPLIQECWEFDERETAEILRKMKDLGLGDGDKVKMPEELRSDKKFKEVFAPDGWEVENFESELRDYCDGSTDRLRSSADTLAQTGAEEAAPSSWGQWGSWGMSSLINSATVGVTTLTNHVTHGLELLDQAVGAPRPEDLVEDDRTDNADAIEEDSSMSQVVQPQLSFGFNDLISGVSSITKLVESTGTKVITGGLGTLETIGKKTMEVLQEGDPGLKKKRAFFLNDGDKPILSQMLREAKEKADAEEKTHEEKQLTRKVHFESLFDDFQGLVHLEALEMLSKQCNMKIQQRLVTLDEDELNSLQETLEEVKELCDLGEEDEEEDNPDDLQERLTSACKDLSVAINYEKLEDIWKDTRTYLSEVSSPESTVTEREVFQCAISTLARFTAFSVERFHKTAELLLIKERRSTVNEADALVQLTRILSGQIGIAANLFSNWLNERMKNAEKIDGKVDITTIFLEAANASSYIQDAFRLLIPILQVGAI